MLSPAKVEQVEQVVKEYLAKHQWRLYCACGAYYCRRCKRKGLDIKVMEEVTHAYRESK